MLVVVLYCQIQSKTLTQCIHGTGQQAVPYAQQPLLFPLEQHPSTEAVGLDAVTLGLITQQLQARLLDQAITDAKQAPQLGGGHLFAAAVGGSLHYFAEINLQPAG
jgi:hypothetical protein